MSVVYRSNGPWGAGKGASLTPAEVDGNFWDLAERLDSIETSLPAGVGIHHLTQSGNQLTVHLTDGTTQGPFTLPTAQWNWKGEWQPATIYFALDVVAKAGSIYLVRHNHTSGADFDPGAEDLTGFRYARLLAVPDISASTLAALEHAAFGGL